MSDHDGVTLRFRRRGHDTEVELIDPDGRSADADLVREIVETILDVGVLPEVAGTTVSLAADHPAAAIHPLAEAVADALRFADRRDLLQLRRPLPIPSDDPVRSLAPTITTRAFRPGDDDGAWLRANNRAFAEHPDQGRETPGTLANRMAEGWFEPAGFLVADDPDRAGEISGFCWTRIHPATAKDPVLGEIYVIGVDPTHRGERLGLSLTLAGLDHIAGRHILTAILYVDADSTPALRLYDELGFTAHRRRRVYTAEPGAPS